VLGTRYGIAAVDLVQAEDWGKMVALQGNEIKSIPLEQAIGDLKMVGDELYDIARVFFG
jgi:6-phosphofructokinase 1